MNNNVEQWKWVKDYENRYKVSNKGQVKSFVVDKTDGRLLKPADNGWGYRVVALRKDGKTTTLKVHRLVALAFIPNPENKPQVNHIDEDKTNNNVSNLEWATAAENNSHGTRTERASEKTSKPVRNVTTGVIYESQAVAAKELGLSQGNISSCCTGKLKTTGGFQWEYVQEID